VSALQHARGPRFLPMPTHGPNAFTLSTVLQKPQIYGGLSPVAELASFQHSMFILRLSCHCARNLFAGKDCVRTPFRVARILIPVSWRLPRSSEYLSTGNTTNFTYFYWGRRGLDILSVTRCRPTFAGIPSLDPDVAVLLARDVVLLLGESQIGGSHEVITPPACMCRSGLVAGYSRRRFSRPTSSRGPIYVLVGKASFWSPPVVLNPLVSPCF